jgi:hypothetical protein
MPNYMHGIIVLNDVRATLAVALNYSIAQINANNEICDLML